MIERSHKRIMDAFSKTSNGGLENWVMYLPFITWAGITKTREDDRVYVDNDRDSRVNYANRASSMLLRNLKF